MTQQRKPGFGTALPVRRNPTAITSIQTNLDKTSPFRQDNAGPATLVVVGDQLGQVTTAGGINYEVALPCEHFSFDGGCRFGCDEWRAAITAVGA